VLAPLLMGGALGSIEAMFLPNAGAGFRPLISIGRNPRRHDVYGHRLHDRELNRRNASPAHRRRELRLLRRPNELSNLLHAYPRPCATGAAISTPDLAPQGPAEHGHTQRKL
jgi:hypothetical protein